VAAEHCRTSLGAVVLLSALLCGCGPDCDEIAEVAAEVVLGTGASNDDYRPVVEGETLGAIFGGQGGQHIWSGFQAWGMYGGPPLLNSLNHDELPEASFTIEGEPGVLAAGGPNRFEATLNEDGSFQAAGQIAFLNIWPEALPSLFPDNYEEQGQSWDVTMELLRGVLDDIQSRDWLMSVHVTDQCGFEAEASATIRVSGLETNR
jgi:hypothetical protein